MTGGREERFRYELAYWTGRVAALSKSLGDYPEGTADGRLLRLQLADAESWRDHYARLLGVS